MSPSAMNKVFSSLSYTVRKKSAQRANAAEQRCTTSSPSQTYSRPACSAMRMRSPRSMVQPCSARARPSEMSGSLRTTRTRSTVGVAKSAPWMENTSPSSRSNSSTASASESCSVRPTWAVWRRSHAGPSSAASRMEHARSMNCATARERSSNRAGACVNDSFLP